MASKKRTWLYKADSAIRNEALSFHWTPNREILDILEANEAHWKKSKDRQIQIALSFLSTNFARYAIEVNQVKRLRTSLQKSQINLDKLNAIYNELREVGPSGIKMEFWETMNESYLKIDHPLPFDLADVVESKFQYWMDYGKSIEEQYDRMMKEFQKWIREVEIYFNSSAHGSK